MKESVSHKSWSQTLKTVTLDGFAFGSRYPVILVSFTGHGLREKQLAALTKLLQDALPALKIAEQVSIASSEEEFRMSVEWLLNTMHLVQRVANQPVYECGRILSLEQNHARFFLPTGLLSTVKPLLNLLRILLELMENQVQGKNAQKQLKRFIQTVTDLRKNSPRGGNVPFFIQAAFKMGMSFQELPANVLQYGQGKHGYWMYSSFSEETSIIATILSKNKLFTAAVLQRAGIPVPEHKIAFNVDRALRVAENFGYPVVVKPADLDAGLGVAVNLHNHEELVAAFKSAQKYSRNILVEKYYEGKDYRITVFHNEVLSAVERVPGGVTGDGEHTVRELVEQLNADPLRGEDRHALLKKLMWNNEAITLLKHAGLDGSSVPAPGEFVRLRRAANVAAGGTPITVLDQMHPDNRRLAIRAAQALHLDLAGVDILIPDIAESWRKTGAVICEVNGQPNLGRITEEKDLFTPILRKLVPGNGRIPITVVLGDLSSGKLANDLETELLKQGIGAGCSDARGIRVNGQVVTQEEADLFIAGQILTVDRNVEAIVLNVNDSNVLLTGLPFARFDFLVLAGEHVTPLDNVDEPASDNLMRDLLELILPACDGKVIPIKSSGLNVDQYKHLAPVAWEKPVAQRKALKTLTADMLAHPGTMLPGENSIHRDAK